MFKLRDTHLLYIHQYALNKANAASIMNCKGDPCNVVKTCWNEFALSSHRPFLQETRLTKGSCIMSVWQYKHKTSFWPCQALTNIHGMYCPFSIHLPRKSFLLICSGSFCELILSCFDFSGISTCHEENIIEANYMYTCGSINNEFLRCFPWPDVTVQQKSK